MRMQGRKRTPKSEIKREAAVSRPIGTTDESLFTMLVGQEKTERRPKTVEFVDGVAQFYMVIPCSVADKPDKIAPLYLVTENALGGPESGIWQCQECGRIYNSRRSWEKHKGIRWITGPEIKVCA